MVVLGGALHEEDSNNGVLWGAFVSASLHEDRNGGAWGSIA